MIGNTGNQYQSHLKYNSFYPKENVKSINFNSGQVNIVDSGFYDPNFKEINSDPDLLAFWEILNDSSTFMNMTLSDGASMMTHNSLPHMKKFTTDILLDKNMGTASKVSTLLTNTKEYIGNLFSTKVTDLRANDVENINKSNIKNIEQAIGLRLQTRLLEESNRNNGPLTREQKKKIREEVTHEIAMEQAFNLPVVMRAYLDMVSEYKSQKDSLPKISIFKDLYENIQFGS